MPIGTVTIRTTRDGCQRAFIKVEHPNKWKLRAAKTWEEKYGAIPTGKLIHHHDRNTMNDAIENLRCLTRAEHALEHRAELRVGRWGY